MTKMRMSWTLTVSFKSRQICLISIGLGGAGTQTSIRGSRQPFSLRTKEMTRLWTRDTDSSTKSSFKQPLWIWMPLTTLVALLIAGEPQTSITRLMMKRKKTIRGSIVSNEGRSRSACKLLKNLPRTVEVEVERGGSRVGRVGSPITLRIIPLQGLQIHTQGLLLRLQTTPQ